MPKYDYILENGTVTSETVYFKWESSCHKEGILDGWKMFVEPDGFGWSVCRLCGKEASFSKSTLNLVVEWLK